MLTLASSIATCTAEGHYTAIAPAGLLHWPARLRLRKQFRVVAVWDIDPAAASEVAGLVGLDSWTERYQDLLADPAVEAVLISVPIHLTAEILLAAARVGKHISCERPLASNMPYHAKAKSLWRPRRVEGLACCAGLSVMMAKRVSSCILVRSQHMLSAFPGLRLEL